MNYSFTSGDKHLLIEVQDSDPTSEFFQLLQEKSDEKYAKENIILHLPAVENLSKEACEVINWWSKYVISKKKSFVISSLVDELQDFLPNIEHTPTISEAQDIIFMEEVERDIDAHFDE